MEVKADVSHDYWVTLYPLPLPSAGGPAFSPPQHILDVCLGHPLHSDLQRNSKVPPFASLSTEPGCHHRVPSA